MNIKLDVALGKWRDLTPKELTDLNLMLDGSSKTFE